MIKVLLTLLILTATAAWGADITLRWDASDGAEGYRIYQSTDTGAMWDAGADVGNVTQYTITVPDSGLVLIRIGAYNAQGEVIRYNAGAWYNGDWKLPNVASGAGVE